MLQHLPRRLEGFLFFKLFVKLRDDFNSRLLLQFRRNVEQHLCPRAGHCDRGDVDWGASCGGAAASAFFLQAIAGPHHQQGAERHDNVG